MKDFEKDLDDYLKSKYCTQCGSEEITYQRTVANGEVWICNECKYEMMLNEEPNPDNY